MDTETSTKTTWQVDPMHSEVNFKVRHLVISTVTGSFNAFRGSLESEGEDFDGAQVQFEVETASVNTKVADRDAHLRSTDFFDVENFPKMTFNGQMGGSGSTFEIDGELSIKNTTKPIRLKAELGGVAQDPYGNIKAGFEISGKLNRKEFGLTWHQITEAGGVVVGDEVGLSFNIQLAKS